MSQHPINLTLPDGATKQVPAGTTGYKVAHSISPGLAKAAVCITVNDRDQDLSVPLATDATIAIGTVKNDSGLDAARHTLTAQCLARAVKEQFPHAKLAIGPTIQHGFYYDVDFGDAPLREEDLAALEKRMKHIVKENNPIQRHEFPVADVRTLFADEPYKLELINDIEANGQLLEGGKLSVYEQTIQGKESFWDLCVGPHAPKTGVNLAFTITNLAGAYWRGDSNNTQLTRIYGLAFATKEELAEYQHNLEEAKKRDHRKIGKEMGLFAFKAEIGSGLPLWLPKGNIIRQELEKLAIEEEGRDGYQRVTTPILAKADLYHQSGHLPYYEEDLYAPIEIDKEKYYLRPMNCPHHHHVFTAQQHSYRDLPYRIAEYGNVFRYEASGALSGLMRVRGFCQNDAHIYCTKEQAVDEFLKVMDLHKRFYNLFGITDDHFYMRLSKPDLNKLDKYVDEPEAWLDALKLVQEAMAKSGMPYVEAEGEAAFYGPKIDFQIKSVLGTEFTASTNQLDFLAPKRFDLNYQGKDGTEKKVDYVIHRAPLGSHERFTAFLIEHYAGRFPTWLAPVQAMVIPITDDQNTYARELQQKLQSLPVHNATNGLRVEVDTASERMQKKILMAQQQQIPYMLVVGKQEAANGTIAVRLRDGTDLGAQTFEWLAERLKGEVTERMDVMAG